ncbi:MAG: 50S ribosomal protein L11 methyltransferase [Pseudomonadales bacterium]
MAWFRVRLNAVTREHAGQFADVLAVSGALAVSLYGADGGDVLEPGPGEVHLWPNVAVEALFPLETDIERVRTLVETAGLDVLQFDFLGDDDWSVHGTASDSVLQFGSLSVVPRNASHDNEEGVIRLDPGLAFGTGRHATTALCLRWLGKADLRDRSILDFGCGSGILAIGSAKRGANRVVAVDLDPQALTACRDNAAYNHVAIEVDTPVAACAAGRFDVVIANILAGTLMELSSTLVQRLGRGSQILLSGILVAQVDEVRAAYEGIIFAPPVIEEGWVLLYGQLT